MTEGYNESARIGELEKENAELKESRQCWMDEYKRAQARIATLEKELKETTDCLDKWESEIHRELDSIGVPTSEKFPGVARDGLYARIHGMQARIDELKKLREAVERTVERLTEYLE